MLMTALVGTGDEVLVPSPCYSLWSNNTYLGGGKPVHYRCAPENDWNPDLEDIRRKIIGDDKVITHRPADDIAPELEKYREEIKDWAQQDEDVLSYALFPQVAMKFFAWRKEKQEGTLLPEISVKVLS